MIDLYIPPKPAIIRATELPRTPAEARKIEMRHGLGPLPFAPGGGHLARRKPATRTVHGTYYFNPNSASARTFTTTGVGTGFLVVVPAWGGPGSRVLTSASIKGVAATIAAQNNGTNTGHAIIYANVTADTDDDVVLNFDGSTGRQGVALYRLDNLLSQTPHVVHFPAGGGSSSRTATLDVPKDGLLIASAYGGNDGGVPTAFAAGASIDIDSHETNHDHLAGGLETSTLLTNHDVTATCRIIGAVSWR